MEVVAIKIQIISIIIALAFFLFIGNLVRKKKLREEYGLIWIICAIIMIVFALWRPGLDVLARFFGVYYAPSLVFMFAIFILIIICIQLLVAVTSLQDKVKKLSQEMALYKEDKNKDSN